MAMPEFKKNTPGEDAILDSSLRASFGIPPNPEYVEFLPT